MSSGAPLPSLHSASKSSAKSARHAAVGDLDPGLHLGQARTDLGDGVAELRAIDHGLRVGVVEDVEDLFGV